jgi:hypothetical protein
MGLDISVVDGDGGNVNGEESGVIVVLVPALALSASHWTSLKTSQPWEDSGEVASAWLNEERVSLLDRVFDLERSAVGMLCRRT